MIEDISQSRVMVTCLPHKQEITGSTPVSAIRLVGLSGNIRANELFLSSNF